MKLDDLEFMPDIYDFESLPTSDCERSYLTIGNFDGVHLGHQALIREMIEEAGRKDTAVIVVTFYPNPVDFFKPELNSFYLSTPQEKETFLTDFGVDRVITFSFDHNFANLSAREFLMGMKEKLGLQLLVVGHDFALGKNRQGTIPVIQSIGEEISFSLEIIGPVNVGGKEISSTRIRSLLDTGDVAGAARLLGRPYEVSGIVEHGSDRGASIGLPTANIKQWSKKKLPGVGVYATEVIYKGELHLGITNVGYRPTFENQDKPNVETHILDFDRDIYEDMLTIKFNQKIRDEEKFASLEAFLEQIERDKAAAREIFRNER